MHDDQMDDADRELVARIGPVLRRPEQVGAGFEERLMASVRADIPSGSAASVATAGARGSRWKRSGFSMSPLAGLALAAGLSAIVATTTVGAYRMGARDAASAGRDTIHVVQFVFMDHTARNVSLVGDFNGWTADSTPLSPGSDGLWSAAVPLRSGVHQYAFIVDGEHWIADPLAASTLDEFDTPSSIVNVGYSVASATSDRDPGGR